LDELIDTLSPKPLFKVGPAKLRNGMDFKIYEIYIDRIHGAFKTTCGNWETAERLSDGTYLTDSERDILPNNEPEKVYGPQECNKTAVKTCENCNGECNGETAKCFACHNYSEWEPAPTDKELWDRVLAVEKAHKDAAESKLKFGDVAGSKKEHTTEDKKPVKEDEPWDCVKMFLKMRKDNGKSKEVE